MTDHFSENICELEAGIVQVYDIHLTYGNCLHGGPKQSGFGRTQGAGALKRFPKSRAIYWNTADYHREHVVVL